VHSCHHLPPSPECACSLSLLLSPAQHVVLENINAYPKEIYWKFNCSVGTQKYKTFKEKYEPKLDSQRNWSWGLREEGALVFGTKKSSLGGVQKFPGAT